MTMKELYGLLPLHAELEHERMRKYRLQQQAASIVPTLTGMPRGSDNESKVERFAIKIHDTELRIVEIENRINEMEMFIENISDDLTRCIAKLKFQDGLTYRQIAGRIGGNNTGDNVKMILHRYFWHGN